MTVGARLLGYDARVVGPSGWSAWSEERREDFLLRPDVPAPLSTSRGCGRTCGSRPPPRAPPTSWLRSPYCPPATAPGSRRSGAGSAGGATSAPPRRVSPRSRHRHARLAGRCWATTSPMRASSAVCPTAATRRRNGRGGARWDPHLNGRHLFANPGQARAFREASDVRVREHAPFFIYGLYGVPDAGDG